MVRIDEIVNVHHTAIIAAEIVTIKEQTQRIVISASIRDRPTAPEAKDLVQHGEWSVWLQEKCNYSQRTADNLMRVYREYGNSDPKLSADPDSQTFANLTYSLAVALLMIPADERSNFLEKNDVGQISIRELQEVIQARDAAEKEKARLEEQARQMQNKLEGINQHCRSQIKAKSSFQDALTQSNPDNQYPVKLQNCCFSHQFHQGTESRIVGKAAGGHEKILEQLIARSVNSNITRKNFLHFVIRCSIMFPEDNKRASTGSKPSAND